MKIRICTPSWHRPEVETLKYIPWAAVYTDPAETEEYKRRNEGAEIVKCAEGVQGNLCRVRNWILDKEFEDGADVVLIVDDDLQRIRYWEGNKRTTLETCEIMGFLETYSRLCDEWGFKMWGVNCISDKAGYAEFRPFSTVTYLCGPFQCHLRGSGIRYDERLPLKEDYDISLQQCNKWRGVLRVNKYFLIVRQAENKGGCATYRNFRREKEQLELLRRKWGVDIVRNGDGHQMNKRCKKGKKAFDFNPIIRIPIRGL